MLEKITITQARVLLVLAVVLCFASAVKNDYSWDDEFVTTASNPVVAKGIKGIPEAFLSMYSEAQGKEFGYRPVAVATYALEYSIFGFNPHISHLVNILLYALLVLIVFNVLRMLLKEHPLWIPFLVTLVFAVHPLHNEVVVSLKNREEILVGLAGFTTFRALLIYTETKKAWLIAAALLALLAGFFVKVSVYPFVFLIPPALWYFEHVSWKMAVKTLAMLMGVGILYTLVTVLALDMGMQNREMDFVENPMIHWTFRQRVPVAFSVFAEYLRMFVIPYPLLCYYGLGQVAVTGWTGPGVWAGVALAAGIAWLFLGRFRKNKVLVFGLFFMVLSIAPFLNLLWLAPGILAERFAFTAVLGFALVLVSGFAEFYKSPGRRLFAGAVLVFVLLVYTAINMLRNPDWDSKQELLEADAAKAPGSVKLQTALAEVYHARLAENLSSEQRARCNKLAEEGYKKAISLYPQHGGAYNNLGVLMASEQRLDEARQYLEKAIALGYLQADTWYNLGAVYEMTGQGQKASEAYKKGLEIDPAHAGIKSRMGIFSTK